MKGVRCCSAEDVPVMASVIDYSRFDAIDVSDALWQLMQFQRALSRQHVHVEQVYINRSINVPLISQATKTMLTGSGVRAQR